MGLPGERKSVGVEKLRRFYGRKKADTAVNIAVRLASISKKPFVFISVLKFSAINDGEF